MALDPRSRERLEALGRTLPKPLPLPEPPRPGRAEAPRHAVETEQNPEQLFRELMGASRDGKVPPHLMDRLRQLEQERQRNRPAAAARPSGPPVSGQAPPPATASAADLRNRRESRRKGSGARRSVTPGSEEAELYSAFAQLLLEDEELD